MFSYYPDPAPAHSQRELKANISSTMQGYGYKKKYIAPRLFVTAG
eukprot:CAMPEP_0173263258 /NCGR_PEP_ID=MMETSP1142-20121109/27257_1 /TAXON_ID=483371 /ORGANISM="non described non described, Strain CCMP2298" /LENGTH=44 /DNA_ID= /DNA_START= /DNA_END= /DNA_ORIENTATION=